MSKLVKKSSKQVGKRKKAIRKLISRFLGKPKVTKVIKKQTAIVQVDSSLGDSQGILPIPDKHEIINREKIIIITTSGKILGRASSDGLVMGGILGGHVTGYISTSGQYSLVFNDVNLGKVSVHYDIVQVEE